LLKTNSILRLVEISVTKLIEKQTIA